MKNNKPKKRKPKIAKMRIVIQLESPFHPLVLKEICRELLYSSIQPGELAALINFKN